MSTLIHVPFFAAAFEEDQSRDQSRETPAACDNQAAQGTALPLTPMPERARPGFLKALLRSLAAWAC
ncbi:MAG: hypothetical protein L0Z62_02695 [Gemmataceae bacterium]|nr:hypothetical protein [Gemmataceae bacterium]